MRRLNEIRHAEPALQRFENVRFLETHNEQLLGYAKGREVAVVVNLDPFAAREGLAVVPPDLGLPAEFPVTDLLTGERYRWRVGRNYVGLARANPTSSSWSVTPKCSALCFDDNGSDGRQCRRSQTRSRRSAGRGA